MADTAMTTSGTGKSNAPVYPRNVLVVDDHPLFCDALSLTLTSIVALDSLRTADRLEAALAAIDQSVPDLVVLDLNLPDVDGLDGLQRIRTAAPRTPVIVVSSIADNRMIGFALRNGAAGYVPKHSQRAVFRSAVDCIARGETFRPDGFIDSEGGDLPAAPEEVALERMGTLTNQQARILQLICEGKLNKQIAYDLGIAETTVKAHVTAIMRKLGVQSRTQAVLVAQSARFSKLLPDT